MGSPEAEAEKPARYARRRPAVFLVHLRFVRSTRQVELCASRPPVAGALPSKNDKGAPKLCPD